MKEQHCTVLVTKNGHNYNVIMWIMSFIH